jgi:hypothetical protein
MYATKKVGRDLCATKKFDHTYVPQLENFLTSMPFPSDLDEKSKTF